MPVAGDQLPERPERAASDEARVIFNAATAAIPFVGGSLNEVLHRVLKPGIDKRHDEWLDEIAAAVNGLISQVGDLSEGALADNELFVSGVVQASRIALGTQVAEKRQMLRSAVINLASGDMTDDFLAHRFLAFVEELMPEHFALLSYATNPARHHPNWRTTDAATPWHLMARAELPFDRNLNRLLVEDLTSKHLIVRSGLDEVAKGAEAVRPFSTKLGAMLIDFVSAAD